MSQIYTPLIILGATTTVLAISYISKKIQKANAMKQEAQERESIKANSKVYIVAPNQRGVIYGVVVSRYTAASGDRCVIAIPDSDARVDIPIKHVFVNHKGAALTAAGW